MVLLVVVLVTPISQVSAQLEWDGGGATNNWSDVDNWDPSVVPNSTMGVVIEQNAQTIADQDFIIKSLALGSAASVYTGTNRLTVAGGDVELTDSALANISRSDSGVSLHVTTGSLNITNGTLAMTGGVVQLDHGSIDNHGVIGGFGNIHLGASVSSAQTVFANNGLLQATRATGASSTSRSTLAISSNDALARMDLDGASNSRTVNINEMMTLDLDMALSDFFSGNMNFEAGSRLDTEYTIQVSSGGVITVDAEATATAASNVAQIRGGLFRMRNGSVMNINSGVMDFESSLQLDSGSSINTGTNTTLIFGGTSTINGTLSMGGGSVLTVRGDTTIGAPTINLDGVAGNGVVNVENAAHLDINSSLINGLNNDFTGQMNVQHQSRVVMPGSWALKGELNLNGGHVAGGGVASIQGAIVASDFSNAINQSQEFFGNGSTDVADGAMLSLFQSTVFHGGSQHTGGGTLLVAAGATFTGSTAMNMPEGIVWFGSLGSRESQTYRVEDNLTINAETFQEFGTNEDELVIDGIDAAVNVDLTAANASWTLHQDGRIHITGGGGFTTTLAGSDIRVDGEINVDKGTRFDARVDVAGNININQVANTLNLNGGTTSVPNRMSGGLINGPGTLASNKGMVGFGTINAPIAFGSTGDLFAELGTLTINAGIVSADEIGARAGATIVFGDPFDISSVNRLRLVGGTAAGATISGIGVIEGYGTIQAASLVNSLRVSAIGGDLLVDTASALDLDGAGASGQVEALAGNLIIADALTDPFGGTAAVGNGFTLTFLQPWALESVGRLTLNGSATPAVLDGAFVQLHGTIEANQQTQIRATSRFRSSSRVTMSHSGDILRLLNDSTIYGGANFSGFGRLVAGPGNALTLRDTAEVGVEVEVDGLLQIDGFGTAQVDSLHLNADAAIQFHIDSSIKHSQLIVTNDAFTTDGRLMVEILSNYEPGLADEFLLLRADLISSSFESYHLPVLGEGLAWHVDHQPQELWLRVVTDSISGDFDNDGNYSCADIDALVATIANGSDDANFDLTGDGQVNNQDLQAWLVEAGAAELPSGSPFLAGDANLDGAVDVSDFNVWNANKFTAFASWCRGDFTADGFVDASDFNVWNGNKFKGADSPNAVPEPESGCAAFLLAGLMIFVSRRSSSASFAFRRRLPPAPSIVITAGDLCCPRNRKCRILER